MHGESNGGASDVVYTRTDAFPDFDDFDHPIAFSTLPFQSLIGNPIASNAADDPVCPGSGIGAGAGTVWYAFTPVADARILAYSPPQVDGSGNGQDIAVSVYSGERGALEQLACGYGSARVDVVAGRTYHIMLGVPVPSPTLVLRVDALPPPPANDTFDDATVLGALPFNEEIDMYGAAVEIGDPAPCGNGLQWPNVWYAYTPTQDTRLTIDTTAAPVISVYSGPRDALVLEGCGGPRLSVTAHAGRTYHLMISSGVIFSTFGNVLRISITGAPALGIEVSVAPDGMFDPRSGAAVVHGSATCTRPARIVVSGTLQQEREKAQGSFRTTIACAGVTAWSAAVAADPDRGRHARFTGGPAAAAFEAAGVPDDNPDDAAHDGGRTSVDLRGTPPHQPAAATGAPRGGRLDRD